MSAPFALRPGRESDWPFVMDSWLKSNMQTATGREMLAAGIYWTEHKATVRRLLTEQRLTCAVDPQDDDAILGWACTSAPPPGEIDPRVFYVYVKGKRGASARRLGIARTLLAEFLPHPCTYTHNPPHGHLPIPDHWAFNPRRNDR